MENSGNLTYIFFGIIALIGLVGAIVFFNFFAIWLRALTSGAKVSYTELIALRLRGVPVGPVVNVRITAIKSGLPLSIDELSTHFLAWRKHRSGGPGLDSRPQSEYSPRV